MPRARKYLRLGVNRLARGDAVRPPRMALVETYAQTHLPCDASARTQPHDGACVRSVERSQGRWAVPIRRRLELPRKPENVDGPAKISAQRVA
jgi:hypothetical protein